MSDDWENDLPELDLCSCYDWIIDRKTGKFLSIEEKNKVLEKQSPFCAHKAELRKRFAAE